MDGPDFEQLAPVATALARAGVWLAASLSLTGCRVAGRRLVVVVGLGLALAMIWPRAEIPYDFKRFWLVGRDLNAGVDYYALPADHPRDPILNPPTALPLFRLLALMPLPTAAAWWNGFTVVVGLSLVPAALSALRAQAGEGSPFLGHTPGVGATPLPQTLVLLAGAVGVSCAQEMGLALGQVSGLVALAIVMGLRAQGLGRPLRAGVWLAIATIKVHTLLPFLLLFTRRRDLPSWASMAITCALLCLAGGPLDDLPRRCERTFAVISRTQESSAVNDYSEAGPSHASLVGLDPLLYRSGVSDRTAIARIRSGVLGVAGLGLAWAVVRRWFDRPKACVLVTIYSCIFLYHRLYDGLVLVIPIVWAAAVLPGRARWGVGAACLAVWFVDAEGLLMVERWAGESAWLGRLAAGGLLPVATWLVVFAGVIAATGVHPREAQQGTRVRGVSHSPTGAAIAAGSASSAASGAGTVAHLSCPTERPVSRRPSRRGSPSPR